MNRPEDVTWEFGSFRLDTEQRLLLRNEEVVPLSRKAVEILLLLVERHGQLVEKEELMRTVWPDAFVEDPREAVRQVEELMRTRRIRTLCVHGDNPQALAFVRALREALTSARFTIAPFA